MWRVSCCHRAEPGCWYSVGPPRPGQQSSRHKHGLVIREIEESPYSVAVLAVKLAGAAERSLMHSLWWEGRPGESSQGRDKAGLGESSPVNVPPGSQKSLSGLWSGQHFRLRADNNFSLWNFIVLVQETLKSVLSFQPNKGSDCWSLSC